jgi:hypothetical protein
MGLGPAAVPFDAGHERTLLRAGAGPLSTNDGRPELASITTYPRVGFPYVANSHLIDAIVVAGIFAAIGVGFALFNVCGGGFTLALFGGAIALLGYALGRSNAWATIIPVCIVTLTLVGAGVYAASVAGCHL